MDVICTQIFWIFWNKIVDMRDIASLNYIIGQVSNLMSYNFSIDDGTHEF